MREYILSYVKPRSIKHRKAQGKPITRPFRETEIQVAKEQRQLRGRKVNLKSKRVLSLGGEFSKGTPLREQIQP